MSQSAQRTALVIDGSSGIRLLLQTCVQRSGYDVKLADGCRTAEELLATGNFDVIIAEVHLADGSILECLRGGYPHLLSKTIVLTSAPPPELRHHNLTGIAAMLIKPFELMDLMEAIGRVGGETSAVTAPRLNVLVVDDDATFTYTMKRSFEAAGATVTAMTSGEDAVRAIKSQEFDLIVVDLVLFDVPGTDILAAAAQYAPSMMRIAVSGFDDAIAKLAAGVAHAVYRKPVDFPNIAHVLASAARHQ